MAFLSVRYDRNGDFASVTSHATVQDALADATVNGCSYASIGEHPKAERQRHFARQDGAWRELESGEALDRLLRPSEQPRLMEWAA